MFYAPAQQNTSVSQGLTFYQYTLPCFIKYAHNGVIQHLSVPSKAGAADRIKVVTFGRIAGLFVVYLSLLRFAIISFMMIIL